MKEKVKEPKVTVEEAFDLVKKHLLFVISDNEDKDSYSEGLGLPKSILDDKNIGKLGFQVMSANSKTDIARIILENSNSLAEVILLLHGSIESAHKVNDLLSGGLAGMLKGLQGDKDE